MENFILTLPRICNEIRKIVVRKIRAGMKKSEVAKLLEINHTTVHYTWKKYLCTWAIEDKKKVEGQRFQQKETDGNFVDIQKRTLSQQP